MSITFSASNTPMIFRATHDCQCAWDGEPAVDCLDCKGEGKVSFSVPEGSFDCHNVGGAALCRLLDLECEYGSGSVERSEFPTVRRAIMNARNRRSAIQAQTIAGYELEPGHAGTRVVKDDDGIDRIQSFGAGIISGGCDESYFERNIRNFERLLEIADHYGSDCISWG